MDLIKQDKTLKGHPNFVCSVAFSPDGKMLASGSWDKNIILWDVNTGNKIRTLMSHSDKVESVAFSPDGKTLASGSWDKNIILWDVNTGKKIRTLTGHAEIESVAFSPDGKTLASGSWDKNIILWDVNKGKKIKTLIGHADKVESIAFSPDGKTLASGSWDKNIILWDVNTGKKIRTLTGHSKVVISVAFSPDGKILSSGSDILILWDTGTGNKIKTLTGHSKIVHSVAFSPDGKILSSGSWDRTIILWDINTGNKINTLTGHSHIIHSVAFSPDGKILASGSEDKNIILWDTTVLYLSRVCRKDEFETTKEYEERTEKIIFPYSSSVTPGNYNADKGGFEAAIKENMVIIAVPREKAKEISERKGGIYIEGKIKCFDTERVELIDAVVVYKPTDDRFAVIKPAGVDKKLVPKLVADIDNVPVFKEDQKIIGENDVAVVIGIEKYQQGLPTADYSTSDANIVREYLSALGFKPRNITLLTNEMATVGSIRKTIKSWLQPRIKKGSRVFVYYSGHGAPDPKTGRAYIVPYDGDPNYISDTGYPLDELYETLGKLEAEEVTVVLDACFSGAGGRGLLAKGTKPLVMEVKGSEIPPNMVVIASTQRAQISMTFPEKGHGLFTYYFLKALKEGKKVIGDIYEYIKPLVEDEAKLRNVEQSPNISPELNKVKGRFRLFY